MNRPTQSLPAIQTAKLKAPVAPATSVATTRFIGAKPRLPIEVEASNARLSQMLDRVEAAWRRLGEAEPHWSVLSAEHFQTNKIGAAMDEFHASGKIDADLVDHALARNGLDPQSLRSCLEFGCGVGRVTQWLAKKFERVDAYDISESHLRLARQHQATVGLPNVRFHKLHGIDQLRDLDPADFVYSRIVLQHNPPPVMAYLLRNLLRRVNPGGFAFFQAPTYLDHYRFDSGEYLSTPPDADIIEMHVIPQNVVFQIADENDCRVIEVSEDDSIGFPPGGISNTFLLQKR